MYSNILITGGAGFIGSAVAIKLLDTGYDISVIDSLESQIHGNEFTESPLYAKIKNKVHFVKTSVADRNGIEKMIQKTNCIIHLAAETGTGQSMYEVARYCNTNINGTAIILDILANTKHQVKKVIVAESRAIYGEGKYECKKCDVVYPIARKEKDMLLGDFTVKCPICNSIVKLLPTDENSLIHPTSVYGITKQVQGQLVHCVCKSLGIPSVSFRYQNVYGPGQSLKNPYTGILSIFSNSLRQNNDINIFEDGNESRDFVFIDDVVDATICAIENEECAYEAFNVGTGTATDVLQVATILKEYYNSSSKINITGNFRLGDIRHNYADISKARKILGYIPKVSFNAGIKLFCEWVNTQPLEEDKYKKSLDEMKNKGLYK